MTRACRNHPVFNGPASRLIHPSYPYGQEGKIFAVHCISRSHKTEPLKAGAQRRLSTSTFGETETRSDVLLIDALGAEGVAETLLDTDFHANAFRHLGGRGVLVMNLAGTRESFAPHVARLLEVFDERVIAMPVREDGNHILLAFRDPAFAPRWNWMRSQALALQARTGLDFPNLARALEAGERQDHAWRLAR